MSSQRVRFHCPVQTEPPVVTAVAAAVVPAVAAAVVAAVVAAHS